MIILLQNVDTLAFAGNNGDWTPDRASAREFTSGHEAVLHCVSHGLSQVQVVYEFPEPEMNFTLRLSTAHIESLRDRNSRRPVTGPAGLLPENSRRKPQPGVRSTSST